MRVETSTVTRLEITEAKSLDPIRVYMEDYAPGKGRITISCYDMAWVGYWGAMGGRTIREFFIACNEGYLASNLMCGSGYRSGENHGRYLDRVIRAVQEALKEHQG